MMKTSLFTLLLLTLCVISLSAQEKVKFGEAIGAKVLFLDHGRANGLDSLDYTNGLEVSYISGINQYLTFALPLKVSVANLAGNNGNRNIASLDGVLHFHYYKPGGRILPYALLGGGLVLEQEKGSYWQVPAGVGLNLRVGANSFVNVQGEYRYTTEENRKSVQLGAGFIYRFAKIDVDRDKDGVKNDEDACPDKPGPLATKGCPDQDGDGIADHLDGCPSEAGPAEKQGCPDQDADGLIDSKDACPQEAGPVATMGCPDRDGDWVADKDDQCPDTAGPGSNKGCPQEEPQNTVADTDGDGVVDSRDDCPDEAGPIANKGCPVKAASGPDRDGDGVEDQMDQCPDNFGPALTMGCPDTDGDGVADKDDRCPEQAGRFSGCPDSDNDGIMDADDRCPLEAGLITNGGCPELGKEVLDVLEFAMRAVQFETGNAALKPVSFEVLNQIAAIMARYPLYRLRITGHTDDVGTRANNQKLSEARAASCYEYLVSVGVDPNRIIHRGFGETRPISSNNTEEGRSLNRRVEFELYVE